MGERILQREVSVERVTRGPMSGAYRLSAMVDGYRVEKTYLYYTKREAIRLFAAHVNRVEVKP